MARETPTDYWNDSCDVDELAYAIARGDGSDSNPNIVVEVLKSDHAYWGLRLRSAWSGPRPDAAKSGPEAGLIEVDSHPLSRAE